MSGDCWGPPIPIRFDLSQSATSSSDVDPTIYSMTANIRLCSECKMPMITHNGKAVCTVTFFKIEDTVYAMPHRKDCSQKGWTPDGDAD